MNDSQSDLIIKKAIRNVNQSLSFCKWFIGICSIIAIIFYLINGLKFYPKEWESLTFWTSILFVIIGVFLMRKFNNHKKAILALSENKFNLWFKYENGDELIITEDIIIPFTKKRIKRKLKFSGVSWGIEHIKYAMDDLKSGNLPFSLLIPNISFSSNKLPEVIYLNRFGGDNLGIYFLDLEDVKILTIDITNNRVANNIIMHYPISKEIDFTVDDYTLFMDTLYQSINYLEGGVVNQQDWDSIE